MLRFSREDGPCFLLRQAWLSLRGAGHQPLGRQSCGEEVMGHRRLPCRLSPMSEFCSSVLDRQVSSKVGSCAPAGGEGDLVCGCHPLRTPSPSQGFCAGS